MTWMRHAVPEVRHACKMPDKNDTGDRDVWMCDECRRMYIWSDDGGYGFEWRRVLVRYWWFQFRWAQSP